MSFASDNGAPAHPAVMDAMLRANTGYTSGYGAEDDMQQVQQTIRDLFEAPNAAVYLVSTGTAANALSSATATPTSKKMNAAHQNFTPTVRS